jgi:hypothetical protein
MNWIRRNLKIVIPVSAVMLATVAFLAFGVFGVHTLFIDDKVDEDGPLFDSAVAVAADDTLAPVATVAPTEAPSVAAPTDTVTPAPAEAPAVTEAPDVTQPPVPQIVTLVEGTFIPLGRYSGAGNAAVLNDGSAQRFLRFENFSTDNGPDLRVYLTASDANADSGTFDDDFIDLGVLKGNIGDQNYEIPPDVDLSIYNTVVVWCVRFSTPFTAADLV